MIHSRSIQKLAAIALVSLLAACGGGGGSGTDGATATGPDGSGAPGGAITPASDLPTTKASASRFLSQATFGASETEITRLNQTGFSGWVAEQMAAPATTPHQDYVALQTAQLLKDQSPSANWIYESFWRQAVSGSEQLRHRTAFALSQIFVISLADSGVAANPRGVAGYMDMLGRNAFGNFRKLLEDVSLHPMMGIYLSHMKNQKADPVVGRVPDENYAREVMQLFSIGLYELNQDGTVKLDSRNEPIETYTIADITGLARVFTGFSWAGPDKSDARFFGGVPDSDRDIEPMQGYPKFHETGPKTFLGTTVSDTTPEASLKAALDRLFMHPNVGPFIGKQLIQRMVTSNPSPQYVARVAGAFADNGQGVRGDMKAVIRAVLLDPEARDDTVVGKATGGKVREPVLRVTSWLRAFDAKSTTGRFLVSETDDPVNNIGQTPMRSPTVFNYFRPGYVPPNTTIAAANLVAPEMQTTHESSVAGWTNRMRDAVPNGWGNNPQGANRRDVQPDYTAAIALADKPDQLVDHVSTLMMAGQMPATLRAQIINAVTSVAISTTNATAAETARKNRVYLAVYLTMASPEFIVQK